MKEAALVGDMATIVDADTAFHGVIVSAGIGDVFVSCGTCSTGRWARLMRSSLDQQGSDIKYLVERHVEVIKALRTRRVDVIRQARQGPLP